MIVDRSIEQNQQATMVPMIYQSGSQNALCTCTWMHPHNVRAVLLPPKIHGGGGLCLPETNPCVQG